MWTLMSRRPCMFRAGGQMGARTIAPPALLGCQAAACVLAVLASSRTGSAQEPAKLCVFLESAADMPDQRCNRRA